MGDGRWEMGLDLIIRIKAVPKTQNPKSIFNSQLSTLNSEPYILLIIRNKISTPETACQPNRPTITTLMPM
jgi:hypothetical protein